MQRNRVVYGTFLVLAMTFSYFYPGIVSSLFFYTILLIAAVSFSYTLYIYFKFSYLQGVDKKFVTKGEKVHFNVDIVNETKILYPYIEILFYGVDTIFTKHFKTKKIAVLPFSRGRYDFEIDCLYRGYYEVGLKQIQIKDFLGLLSFKYQVLEPKYITVYPRIITLSQFPICTNQLSYVEGVLSGKEEDRITISEMRKYAYGDSIKKIHWKLSAKKDEIMVKNFDSTITVGATMLLDLTENPYTLIQNTILEDKVVEAAIAVIHYCLQHNLEVNLIYHDHEMTKKKAVDYSYFESLYHTLFKIKFESQIEFSDTVKLALGGGTERNTVVLVTSNLNEKIYGQISMCRHEGYSILLLYISPADIVPSNEAQKADRETIILALQEMNVRVYKVEINDDIQSILEC
ncbi:MAG: hypothetical protein K0S71_124 [Clostridia bacterium]|jgi:uncharacterized protein (DUF58 family)|nr:hypothetical protein [Clostridia bacterium]